jgi:hypothetical protein
MSVVSPISIDRVRRVLDKLSISHKVDDDGDIAFVLNADDDVAYDVVCFLMLKGSNKEVYQIMLIPSKAIPARKQGEALLACNQWNVEKLYPAAYLQPGDESKVVAMYGIDLEKGIHDELLEDFTRSIVSMGWEFFKFISKKGL